jgi:Fe2+ transport system protein FeoA
MAHLLPLDSMASNDEGVVAEMIGEQHHVKRLQEMGLMIGSKLTMVAPGCPCLVSIDGRRLSLRLEPETEIYITVCQR